MIVLGFCAEKDPGATEYSKVGPPARHANFSAGALCRVLTARQYRSLIRPFTTLDISSVDTSNEVKSRLDRHHQVCKINQIGKFLISKFLLINL